MFGGGEFAFEFDGQSGLQFVLGDADWVGLAFERVLDFDVAFFGAQDDTDRRAVVGTTLLVVEQVQVEVHLAGVLRLELANFEIERNECFEEPMIEQQIDEVFFRAQDHAVLAADKAESVSEFEQEALQVVDEQVFEVAFLDGSMDAQELEVVAALHHLGGLLGESFGQGFGEVVRLAFGDAPLVRTGFDLVE